MREKIVANKWEYEIHEIENEYGFKIEIYKNNRLVFSQGGFGGITIAEVYARDYFLFEEFGIERENEND
jgi:hypothetical protein